MKFVDLFLTTIMDGMQYFISFVDGFFQYANVLLMVGKSNALDVLKIYKTEVEH